MAWTGFVAQLNPAHADTMETANMTAAAPVESTGSIFFPAATVRQGKKVIVTPQDFVMMWPGSCAAASRPPLRAPGPPLCRRVPSPSLAACMNAATRRGTPVAATTTAAATATKMMRCSAMEAILTTIQTALSVARSWTAQRVATPRPNATSVPPKRKLQQLLRFPFWVFCALAAAAVPFASSAGERDKRCSSRPSCSSNPRRRCNSRDRLWASLSGNRLAWGSR
mmetsp:Transcript_23807/g.52430  ORF Transcript_23807/g.52430 Transcript_23807/m.52430 type:complete len:225 (-) Transcript_23807:251-925(-)